MRRGCVLALLLWVCAASVSAANRYDPRLRFRTLNTSRFSIHYHQGEEALARRLAGLAEEVADRVARELGSPNGRVHVILVDQNDLSNGWANPVPYNVIEITLAAPPASSAIGNSDDWLRLVFSHEYTHIVHLDMAGGWMGGLRRLFGRAPLLYPNLFLPLWQIEGLATYSESVLTGQGRVPSADFRDILERAAASRRFDPLDRVNGGLVDWPADSAHYAYGAYFHQYLADRFGAASIARLAGTTSRRVPYFGTRAFKKVFGRSLGDLWADFKADAARRVHDQSSVRTQLTHHGFTVTAPAFSRSGRLFYAIANPHGFPALMELSRYDRRPRRITDKFLGSRISAAGSQLVFDQLEVERNVSLRSDLYGVDPDVGRTRRLTRNARAADPDVSPDGTMIVCTVQSPEGRALATMPLPRVGVIGTPATLVAENGTDFNAPRWSPDGRFIAAERRRPGGPSEIVIVDVAARTVRALVAAGRARNVSPDWMPDGRAILFASDRDGGPFAIYSVPVEGGALRRLEGAGVGVQRPVVSPDGSDLVFVGYTAAGYDLFSLALATATWRETGVGSLPSVQAVSGSGPASSSEARMVPASTPAPSGSYHPWRTLLPQFWMPVIESTEDELSAGAITGGADALGRHVYGASVTWAGTRARPDWLFSYAYDRWWPTLFASVSDDTDPWLDGDVRARELTAGALFTIRRVRYRLSTLAAFSASTDEFDCAECPRPVAATVRRRALHVGWSFNNARTFGYSISRESGTALRAAAESAPEALGSDATTSAVAADARAYVRVGPRHAALAFRAAGASSWGDGRRRRVFSASGAGPQADDFDLGTDAIGLLRGFGSASIVGDRAVVANADFRFPIRHIQRGFGTAPLFFRTLHGAAFADAGNAWTETFQRADVRRSLGAELSLDTVIGYQLPATFTAGIAWRDDPVKGTRGWAGFGRVGRAF